MESSCSEFVNDLKSCLQNGHHQKTLEIIKNPENARFVDECMWDIVAAVCETLSKVQNKDSEVVTACEDIMLNIVKTCKAKEVLLAFLEQIHSCQNDVCFCTLLKPVQDVLLKVPGKRGKSLEWVLSTLGSYVLSLPKPKDHGLEGEELLLLDLDDEVLRIRSILECYISFFGPFVKEVSLDSVATNTETVNLDRVNQQREILLQNLMLLLGDLLAYLDLHNPEGKPPGLVRDYAEQVVGYICRLRGNVIKVHEHTESWEKCIDLKRRDSNGADFEKSKACLSKQDFKVGLGVLGYMLFSEGVDFGRVHSVYSPQYIF